MTKRKLRDYPVTISSPLSLAQHVALFNEVGQDLMGGALGDPDGPGNVTQADARIVGNAQQDVSVVREEVPAAVWQRLPSYSGTIIHEYRIECHQMTARGLHPFDRTGATPIPKASPIPSASPIPDASPIPPASPIPAPGEPAPGKPDHAA
jgi:hypothetical protein